MYNLEFGKIVSRSGFLMDWQKDKLMAMVDNGGVEDDDDDDGTRPARYNEVFPVIDNVLWRMMGVGLASLPPMDRMDIERAVREVTY